MSEQTVEDNGAICGGVVSQAVLQQITKAQIQEVLHAVQANALDELTEWSDHRLAELQALQGKKQ